MSYEIDYRFGMMNTTRRDFLKQASVASIGFLGLKHFAANPLYANAAGTLPNTVGFGPLIPNAEGILALPKGFSMKVISKFGETMSDGLLVPGMPDGMAAFPGENGRIVLVRNHENQPEMAWGSPFGKDNSRFRKIDTKKIYDTRDGRKPCTGGTTTMVYNPKTQAVEKQFLSLGGTERNCAGGPTPWGTWITCEETAQRNDDGYKRDHGYNFEVPANATTGLTQAVPLKAMGRFRHEAVAVDEPSGVIYQSEDTADSSFYRFIPNVKGNPAEGGKLQALVIDAQPVRDTRNWSKDIEAFPIGQSFQAKWIDLTDAESPKDNLRQQAQQKGGAIFARTEGMWAGDGEIYFACTSGGPKTWGQIFRYKPSPYEGTAQEIDVPGELELFIEPNNSDLMRNCDNITIAPWGDVIICEDASSTSNRIVGVTPEGKLYHLALNTLNTSEFAGACFSPDGETLFVNIQSAGLTIAITGPWETRSA